MRDPEMKAFYRRVRMLEIERVKADFRKLEPLPESVMNGGPPVSEGFGEIVDALGHCSPKTRRIACRIMLIWSKMHNPDFNRIMAGVLFGPDGTLRDESHETLIRRLHEALLEFRRGQSSGLPGRWVPLGSLME